ncbi:MAG: MopE-related protein [Myxococcota bacterium]
MAVALLGLTLAACGSDKAKVDNLFLQISSDAPASGAKLQALRILFSKGDKHFPASANSPEFNPSLGALDPVAAPVVLSVLYDGNTFEDGSGVTLQVTGRIDGKPVTSFEGVVDISDNVILKVHLGAIGDACDADGDGFLDCTVSGCCATGSAFADCDDSPADGAAANPWLSEDECNDNDDIDNDCKGGDVVPTNTDGDPVADCNEVTVCPAGAETNPKVYPNATEVCDDLDNDCDGSTDEGLTWAGPAGPIAKGQSCGVGACAGGTVECKADGGLQCSTSSVAHATEGCEGADAGVDDDCDGLTDEGCTVVTDVDGDGVPPPADCNDFDAGIYPGNLVTEACCDPSAQNDAAKRAACDKNCDGDVTFCESADKDGDGFTVAEGDCDDDPSDDATTFPARLRYPGAPEKCGDSVDQDCFAGDLACTGLTDADHDGWSPPIDCNDNDASVKPDAVEKCNGKDDNCSGNTDEGNPEGGAACGTDEGECVKGHEVCGPDPDKSGAIGIICPDDVEPVAELCDGKDNNCDSHTDEAFTYEAKAIGAACDGIGACGQGTVECTPGRTDQATCSTNPNGSAPQDTEEVCDTLDNDCDGDTNENLTNVNDSTCNRNGVCGANFQLVHAACTQQGTWTCDYSDVPAFEAGTETLCDGKDNDCDSGTDEDITFVDNTGATRHVADGCDGADADSCANGIGKCDPSDTSKAFCDESNASNQPEICDGADNDCDGKTDEDYKAGPDQDPAKALSGAAYAADNGKYLAAACGTGTCGVGTVKCNPNNRTKVYCETPSQPSTDVCDGLDNDCNGTLDDRYVSGGDVKYDGGPFKDNPDTITPNDGDQGKYKGQTCGTGSCSGGHVVCATPFTLTCDSLGAISTDTCDDVDNDCNGTTDDRYLASFTGGSKVVLGNAKYTPDNGKSKFAVCGTGVCSNGAVVCNASHDGIVCDSDPEASVEDCEGLDDSCNGTTDEGFPNLDQDSLADCVDPDMDGDGITDDQNIPNVNPDCSNGGTTNCNDNCPILQNSDQADHEGDAIGDLCDPDDDNDGLADGNDACPLGSFGWTSNSTTDHDGDGCQDSNAEDQDDDNDGILDSNDLCPKGRTGWTSSASTDYDGDGCQDTPTNTAVDEDTDEDNDGILDTVDSCKRGVKGWTSTLGTTGTPGTDWDQDGCQDANAEDGDDDNDGVADATDKCVPDNGGGTDGVVGSDKGWTSAVGTTGTPGTDWDADGCRDAGEDTDDDNDGVLDATDKCDPDNGGTGDGVVGSDKGWTSTLGTTGTPGTDWDVDGCQDSGEDGDDDNDGILDAADKCDPDNGGTGDGVVGSDKGWTSTVGTTGTPGTDWDVDGCQDSGEDGDDDNDGIVDATDKCDPDAGGTGDGVVGSDKGWTSTVGTTGTPGTDWDADGCQDSAEDGDDDNDGLADASDKCDPDNGGTGDGIVGSDKGWTSTVGTPGTDYDGDGCQDGNEDTDDDGDGIADTTDQCDPDAGDATGVVSSQKGWTSAVGGGTPGSDYDADGCKDDTAEDTDDDNDGLADATDQCDPDAGDAKGVLASTKGWTSTVGTPGTDYDGDGCKDDQAEDDDDDNDGILDTTDQCDPDAGDATGVVSSVKGWTSSVGGATPGTDYDADGCKDDQAEDNDDDNDGIADATDQCDPDAGDASGVVASVKGWTSAVGSPGTDYDADGCKDDQSEDNDDDNDGIVDATDQCDPDAGDTKGVLASVKGWTSSVGGATPGTDYDADGCKDDQSEDDDDDNDGIVDATDQCDPDAGDTSGVVASVKGWTSSVGVGTPGTDYDADGCKDDQSEDGDDDNDGIADATDQCDPDAGDSKGVFMSTKGWTSTPGTSTPGTDYDADGCKDDQSEDADDDNDGVADTSDRCDPDASGPTGDTGAVTSVKTWTSDAAGDYEGDGCRDSDEDTDDDNDGVADGSDRCDPDASGPAEDTGAVQSQKAWTSNGTTDYEADGCRDSDEDLDDDNDGVLDTADRCDPDASGPAGDTGAVASVKTWTSDAAGDYEGDGCRDSDEDLDDDNDGVADTNDRCDPDASGPTGDTGPVSSQKGWTSDGTSDYEGDGCRDSDEISTTTTTAWSTRPTAATPTRAAPPATPARRRA